MPKISCPYLQRIIWLVTFACALLAPNSRAAEFAPSTSLIAEDEERYTPPQLPNYSRLIDLINLICDDALERFHEFFASAEVQVEPFTTIGFFERNKLSELGMTISDQMKALINNDTLNGKGVGGGKGEQLVTGILQEVDGYLRVHISGVNAVGQRTSFTISVEMSEPLYRALHTYL